MCRDLIFHVHEHRYSFNKIENMLNKFGLRFLGFLLDHTSKEKYSKIYKDDINHVNLSNWSKYEEENPETFRSMYQFWLNKKSNIK